MPHLEIPQWVLVAVFLLVMYIGLNLIGAFIKEWVRARTIKRNGGTRVHDSTPPAWVLELTQEVAMLRAALIELRIIMEKLEARLGK